MVVGTLRIPVSPDRRAEVLEVLWSIQGPVLAQPGCSAFRIFEEQRPEEAIVLVERWDSEAAIEAHIRSESYRRILAAMELSGGPPEISFEHVSASVGIELVERLRNLGEISGPAGRLNKPKDPPKPAIPIDRKEPHR